jgi:threonine dehydrogenase-like Zn-dependent dehydrogenase
MRAITLAPGVRDSARLEDVPEPDAADGALLVRALALGICATDRDILAAEYGEAPPGHGRLILGHESVGIVEQGNDGRFAAGDRVVGIVRRPDPVPCPACAAGLFNRKTVLDNDALFGAVNANRNHYEMAAEALAQADRTWLERLITRRVPLQRWSEALERRHGDIKTIINFTA